MGYIMLVANLIGAALLLFGGAVAVRHVMGGIGNRPERTSARRCGRDSTVELRKESSNAAGFDRHRRRFFRQRCYSSNEGFFRQQNRKGTIWLSFTN